MHDHVRISRKAAGSAAAILLMGLIQLAGAPPAAAAAAADVTVAPVSTAIGSGTVVQQIQIPAASALAGQSTPLVIMPDNGISANGFTVGGMDAGSESGATCTQDSGDAGFTCAAPPSGWTAGGYLDLDFGAGGNSTAAPSCGASCTFTTSVYENDTTDTPATGTVTVEAEATLTLSLSGVTGGALTMTVSNAGPTDTTDLSVDITGQGGYSISSTSAQCGKVGSGFVCDAGDTSGAVNTSDSWTVQFSGSTGPIGITATAYATVYPGGTADTLNGDAPAQLSWTPIATPPPVATATTGPAAGPTPSPTVTVKATATAKTTAKGSGGTVAPGVAKAAKPGGPTPSTAPSAAPSDTAAAVTTSAPSASPQPGVEAGGQSAAKASGGGGVSPILLVLLGILLLAIAALGTWFARRAPSRKRRAGEPAGDPSPVTTSSESAPVAAVPAARSREFAGTPVARTASGASAASAAAVVSLVPGTSGTSGSSSAPTGPSTSSALSTTRSARLPEPESPLPVRTRVSAPESSSWFPAAESAPAPVPVTVPVPAPAPKAEAAPEPQPKPEPIPEQNQDPEPKPDLAAEPTAEAGQSHADTTEEPEDRPFDPMNDTGPIQLDDFFTRRPK